jgi:hypothetical protein
MNQIIEMSSVARFVVLALRHGLGVSVHGHLGCGESLARRALLRRERESLS